MALIRCPQCGNPVSDIANSCPRCGHPIYQAAPSGYSQQTSSNNRWLYAIIGGLVLLALILAIVLISKGCSSSSSSYEATTAPAVETPATPAPPQEVATPAPEPEKPKTDKHYEIESWRDVVSSRRLTDADVADMSNYDLCLLRNLIYANHGYIFKRTQFKEFFGAYSWYTPTSSNVSHSLNSIENYNINFIKAREW